MNIVLAEVSDAPLIHKLMIKAFMAYADEVPPSSALEETVETISTALEDGEKAFIGYRRQEPVGMVRFRLTDTGIYFYRLSVIPENQRKGIAKELVKSLEDHAKQNGKTEILCKVRMTLPKNINLYQSLGYHIHGKEIVHKPNGITITVASMKKKL